MPPRLLFFSLLRPFCCFCSLKMCRQRKVNMVIVPVNNRASPYISRHRLCGGVFSSGCSLSISFTLVYVHTCVHACCVMSVRVEGRRRWGVQVRLCGFCATEGTVYGGSHSDNPHCCIPPLQVIRMLARKYFFSQALCQQSERFWLSL